MNAPIAAETFPLAVISHGRRSYGMVFHILARFLSENGFVVALPNHFRDNLFQRQSACSYQNLEERPKQITAVIDTLTTHKLFGCAIHTNNAGVIGHSAGGYTALAIAGGEPHTGFMVKSALACQPSPSRRDEHMGSSLQPITIIPVKPDLRVRTVVALAPDFSLFVHQGALAKISIPVLLMVAQRDQWAQETLRIARREIRNENQLEMRMIENAGHYAFLSVFPDAMKARVGEPSIDPPGFGPC